MHDTLTLVRGAVSTKDLIPVLTHFHIYSGRIQGGNGRVTIDAPCKDFARLALNVTVPAERFLKAVDACDGNPNLNVTDGGKLTISKGKFRAFLPLAQHDSFPRAESMKTIQYNGALLAALHRVRPFVGEDASRPWVCSIAVQGGEAYATNNVVLVRTACDFPLAVNLPVAVVDELLRIGEEPTQAHVDDNRVQFTYADGSWLQGTLFQEQWLPSAFNLIKDREWGDEHLIDGLRDAVAKVRPFVPDEKAPLIKFGAFGVATQDGDHSAIVAGYDLPLCTFRAEPLEQVLAVATHMDLTVYPMPVPWVCGELEGVLVGVRV